MAKCPNSCAAGIIYSVDNPNAEVCKHCWPSYPIPQYKVEKKEETDGVAKICDMSPFETIITSLVIGGIVVLTGILMIAAADFICRLEK